MSTHAQDLVRQLLDSDPENRITIADVLEHQFVHDYMSQIKPKAKAQSKEENHHEMALKNNIETLAKKETELNDLLGFGEAPEERA